MATCWRRPVPANVLSRALRALGRIERTLFTLQWLSDPALHQRSHAGLNKGEASNALRHAVVRRQSRHISRNLENERRLARRCLRTVSLLPRTAFPKSLNFATTPAL